VKDSRAPSAARLGYVPALDGLRGVAILLVVSVHFFGLPVAGTLGVDLFFVLSGFLITTLLLEERADTGRVRLRAFYVRRLRRLVPALAVLLAAYILVSEAKGVAPFSTVAEYGLYLGNLYQAFAIAGSHHTGLEHLWSLAQEEQFYLVWPALLLIVARARRPALWLGLVFLALVAYRADLVVQNGTWQRVYHSPDTHSEGLVIGCTLAFVRFSRPKLDVPEWLARTALGVFFFGCVAWVGWFMLPIYELAAAVMIAAALATTEFADVVSDRRLVWIGKISYSLYLWHFVIFWAFGFSDWFVALPLSVAVAWLSCRLVEQPFRRRRAQPAIDTIPVVAVGSGG
jgi:peptidoglycan/LPS O-acetylase OafA/YrhL